MSFMYRTALAAMVGAWASLAIAEQPDFDNVEIKVAKVAGNVYMLEGEGGNIGVSVGADGIVIVDDQQANVLEPWQKYSGQFINADTFIETLYNDLTGKKAGKLLQH